MRHPHLAGIVQRGRLFSMDKQKSAIGICNFDVGQIVHHLHYDYRGVIIDVDMTFSGSDEWHSKNRTQPEKDQPWYHVLVDGAYHNTYVAQSNLEADTIGTPVVHPELDGHFTEFSDGQYRSANRTIN